MATDGPFAETKEQLGGIYLVEASSLDDAEAIASRLPMAHFGTVEVRECVRRRPPWAGFQLGVGSRLPVGDRVTARNGDAHRSSEPRVPAPSSSLAKPVSRA